MFKSESIKPTKSGREKLGEILREYRKAKGWSLRFASDYIAETSVDGDLSFSSLGDIEGGKRDIKLENLLLLSQIGYGDMKFSEMVDILTEHRLSLCEKGSEYRVSDSQSIDVEAIDVEAIAV
jgi:transcriptional regulator with XRE-family HTH domain